MFCTLLECSLMSIVFNCSAIYCLTKLLHLLCDRDFTIICNNATVVQKSKILNLPLEYSYSSVGFSRMFPIEVSGGS